MQKLLRWPVVLILRVSGYRFSKWHRQTDSLMYLVFNTVLANQEAGMTTRAN